MKSLMTLKKYIDAFRRTCKPCVAGTIKWAVHFQIGPPQRSGAMGWQGQGWLGVTA